MLLPWQMEVPGPPGVSTTVPAEDQRGPGFLRPREARLLPKPPPVGISDVLTILNSSVVSPELDFRGPPAIILARPFGCRQGMGGPPTSCCPWLAGMM